MEDWNFASSLCREIYLVFDLTSSHVSFLLPPTVLVEQELTGSSPLGMDVMVSNMDIKA